MATDQASEDHLVLFHIQPYLDYGEHTLRPILPALVGQGGKCGATDCQIKVQSRRRNANRVNPAPRPAQPAHELAPRALLFRPRLAATESRASHQLIRFMLPSEC